MLRPISVPLLIGCLLFSTLLFADWRQQAGDAEKTEKLIQLVPGTAHWMVEMGERYKNLYWAAKQGQWEFAEYQVEEIEDLVHRVQLARPKRAVTAQEFLNKAIGPMMKALETREWDSFREGFSSLRTACMHCHTQNDHAFITLPHEPVTAASPVLNLPLQQR